MNFHTIKVLLMGSLIQPQGLFCKYIELGMKPSCPKGFGRLSLDKSQSAQGRRGGDRQSCLCFGGLEKKRVQMLAECNQLLYPQLNSMHLTNNGNLAMLARNSSSHFALASGGVLNSFLHGEKKKKKRNFCSSILSRMFKYLNINSFMLAALPSFLELSLRFASSLTLSQRKVVPFLLYQHLLTL